MSTSAETGVEGSDELSGRHAAQGQGSTPVPSTTDSTNNGVQPQDGSLPSAHTESNGMQPRDGSLVSAHAEPAIGLTGMQPHDGSLVSAHAEPAPTNGVAQPADGSLPSAHTEPADIQA